MAGKVWRGLPPPAKKFVPPPPPKEFTSLGKDAEIGFQVSDGTPVFEALLSLPRFAIDAAGYEMSRIAEEVIKDAKANFVPYDTGNLHDSGNWDDYDPATTQTLAQIGMWFAGDITREQLMHGLNTNPKLYALEQHENMEYDHHGIGGPKYLERPFNNKKPEIPNRLANAIRAAFGDGVIDYVLTGEGEVNPPAGPKLSAKPPRPK